MAEVNNKAMLFETFNGYAYQEIASYGWGSQFAHCGYYINKNRIEIGDVW